MSQLTADNIVLYESEKLSDADDAGGRATSNVVTSGQVNNVFQDISRVDHTTGAVELRKLFLGVNTNNQAPLLGAHVINVVPPEDASVDVLLFQTGSAEDVRRDAQDFVESYMVQSTKNFAAPLGLNLAGSRQLVLFQSLLINTLPKNGETKVLLNTDTGISEYVRFTDVQATQQVFIYQSGGDYKSFTAYRIVCTLAVPLQNAWDGGEARPNGPNNTNLSLFDTVVSDAINYYGMTTLTTEAAAGSKTLDVARVLGQIVPVAQSEDALTDENAAGSAAQVIAAGTATVTVTATVTTNTTTLYTPNPITPGSLLLSQGGNSWQDDGAGGLRVVSGGVSLADATVAYGNGSIQLSGLSAGSVTLQFKPGAAVSVGCLTGALAITQSNRGLVYTLNLAVQKPKPGTFFLQFRTLGNWQSVQDDGFGSLTGLATGTINYTTGTVSLTLPHEPDADSNLVWRYAPQDSAAFELGGGSAQYAGTVTEQSISFNGAIKPSTVSLTNSDNVTLTDDGAGNLTGTGGSGTVDYASGLLTFKPTALGGDPSYSVTAFTGASTNGPVTAVDDGAGGYGFDLGAAIAAFGLTVKIPIRRTVTYQESGGLGGASSSSSSSSLFYRTYHDNGAGGLIDQNGDTVVGGSVNYTTGEVALGEVTHTYTANSTEYTGFGAANVSAQSVTEQLAGQLAVAAVGSFTSFATSTQSFTVGGTNLNLLQPGSGKAVVPGSFNMSYGGKTYYDSNGKIYTDFSALTGAGVEAGTIDYASGKAAIAAVPPSGSVTPVVNSLLLGGAPQASDGVQFATISAPLRPGSLQLTLTNLLTGDVVVATSDENGTITSTGSSVTGSVDFQTGFVAINATFPVFFGNIRYNAVALKVLPLDPDIIGLQTVRLPVDGKVAIFKLGDVAVLNHTTTDALTTPTDGQVVTISRDHLASVVVLCDTTELDPAQYSVDLEAGTITFANPVVLQDKDANALSGTWTASHRIEHMSLITDVQISGQLTLQQASAHVFPVGTSVSSAVLFGDLQSDVINTFDQQTWSYNNPNWGASADSSGPANAEYNDIAYPLQVANFGAVEEKWALVFTSSTAFSIVAKNRGVIGTGNTAVDCAPINPMTSTPYFKILAAGWGSGWATGNVLRFDTVAALAPFWIARTVTPGTGVTASDSFTLSPRGDSQ